MAGASSKGKKKWSKGKVKEKASHAVTLDKNLIERINKEVPGYRLVSVSVLVDRLKINGSLARMALKELADSGIIRLVSNHHSQKIYTRASAE